MPAGLAADARHSAESAVAGDAGAVGLEAVFGTLVHQHGRGTPGGSGDQGIPQPVSRDARVGSADAACVRSVGAIPVADTIRSVCGDGALRRTARRNGGVARRLAGRRGRALGAARGTRDDHDLATAERIRLSRFGTHPAGDGTVPVARVLSRNGCVSRVLQGQSVDVAAGGLAALPNAPLTRTLKLPWDPLSPRAAPAHRRQPA